MRMTGSEIADAAAGTIVRGDADAVVTSFGIDTRRLSAGACFVALRGERDGHDFLTHAADRGATVAVLARPTSEAITQVQVEDPLEALAGLGRRARARLDATVVGITGSTGKTTTKDLVAAALRGGRKVAASPESFNNEFGLPLTLLGASEDTEVVVAELGARAKGNIAELCAIARPAIGVVTNIGLAHAEHLGDPADVAFVKGELLEALPASGLAVVNADDEHTATLTRLTTARTLRVGHSRDADVRVRDLAVDGDLRPHFAIETSAGDIEVALELRGEHQAVNAAMAIAVAVELGVDLADAARGLASATTAPWRMEWLEAPDGVVVLNDAYNANPASMAAALRALGRVEVGGRRIAVLGEMRELGAHASSAHDTVGRLAAVVGVDVLVAVGEAAGSLAAGARAEDSAVEVVEVADADAALAAVRARLGPRDAVLVKASRVVGLERVAAALATDPRAAS
jgi:UDP-N-acetylmuramoyl-tripeptide--D-alanyl-D-alanine ligase